MFEREARPRASVSYEEVESDVDMSDGERAVVKTAAEEEAGRVVWSAKRVARGIPPIPGVSDFGLVSFLDGKPCLGCGGKGATKVNLGLRTRLCKTCRKNLKTVRRLINEVLVSRSPSIHTQAGHCVRQSHEGNGKRYTGGHRQGQTGDIDHTSAMQLTLLSTAWYIEAELEAVSEKLEDLQILDDANPVSTSRGTKSRPTTKVVVELEVDRFIKEKKAWVEKQAEETQLVKEAVEQCRREENLRQEAIRAKARAENLIVQQIKAHMKLEVREAFAEASHFGLDSLCGNRATVDDEYWSTIKDRVVQILDIARANVERRVAHQLVRAATSTRQQLLRPFFNSLSISRSNDSMSIYPLFEEFLHFPNVVPFWKEPTSSVSMASFSTARTSILQDIESFKASMRKRAYKTILLANGTTPSDLDAAVVDASLDDDFFGRFTSTLLGVPPLLYTLGHYPQLMARVPRVQVELMSNPAFAQFLRTVLDAADLDHQVSYRDVEAAGLKFTWAEHKGRGKGDAKLTWLQIARLYFRRGTTRTRFGPLTLTLVEGNFLSESEAESSGGETDGAASQSGNEDGDSDDSGSDEELDD
ncbi:hypothetical protein P7C70_g6886, partial [Phenoliferia sp. Uapishka_3]